MLLRLRLPLPAPGVLSAYRKARVRGAMDFPLAGVACSLAVDGGLLSQLRLAFTGTNSCPFVLQGSDAWLGRSVDAEMRAAIAKLVSQQVSPMRSTVTASNHRRLVAAALAQRLLAELADVATGRPQTGMPCS